MNDTIPNWTMFGARSVFIDFHEVEDSEGDTHYQPSLTFHLDDSVDESEKFITIFTDIFQPTIHEAASMAAPLAYMFTDQIAKSSSIYDSDGLEIESVDIEEMLLSPTH